MTATLDAYLQGGMHSFEDKVPIHGCKVDILHLDSRTWRSIEPADMPADETLYIIRCRQLFNERYVTPYVDDPMCYAPCCVR